MLGTKVERSPQSRHQLRYTVRSGRFAISRLDAGAAIPEWALRPGELTSITRSNDELSIVCSQAHVPVGIKSDSGWVCLKLEGPFPFSMTGVLASFIAPLSANQIPIFALATFDTDYVLIKEEHLERAFSLLQAAGHELSSESV